jgi:SHS family lactate transporter-like MFS transporter
VPSPFRSLSSSQRHAFIACFFGWSLDAFDYFILVFCITSISTDFHEQTSRVAEALFLTLAFRPVGAFLFGALAERFGRRPVLMLNIACYSILELSCAFAPTLASLLVLRALFGIAMGGEWGVGAALAFETLPKENRGFFSGVLQEGYAVGYLVAAAAYAALFPLFAHWTWHGHPFGWRGLFIVGTFLFVVLLMTGFNAFSHGTQDLYPTFLQKDHHFSVQLTGIIAIIYNVGALSGGILFGTLSEKFGRKRAIIAATLLALPVIPLYALSHSVFALTAGAFLMQFMVQGAWGVVPAYLSELSPGPVRATFPGFAYQLGNLITSRNGVLQAKAAERYGSYGAVLAVTVLLVATFLAIVTWFGRESRGTDLQAT